MKPFSISKRQLVLLILSANLLASCAVNLVVLTPNPTNATAQVNGYSMDNAGHYIIVVKFNMAVDPSTVMVGKTLNLRFAKDPNATAALSWSATNDQLTITTTKTRDELNLFHPDDAFTVTLIGTDAGNGAVKSKSGKILDGDYQGGAGGNYVMSFTLIG